MNDGLFIVFDPALDGAGWPGPLDGREAVVGEAWLGPLGLLGRLEIELGLLGHKITPSERAADLARKLANETGPWRRSFETDPIATCRRLLADRDNLAMWGWQGEAVSERLDGLGKVTSNALPGIPDRLRRILELLPRRSVDISTIRIHEPLDSLQPLWRHTCEALRTAGVQIEQRPIVDSVARGDLAAARQPGFAPAGDGSLQLIRPHGPLAAADEVAAALAALGDLDQVLLIGADSIVDEAMVRHGLPRLGADVPAPASCALVRLVIESAFTPMDPSDLHALLCIDPGPVPRGIARRLTSSLNQFPSRGAHTWREGLAKGLDAIEDLERRARVASRLTELLDPIVERTGVISIEQLTTRMRTLAGWARGRLEEVPSLIELVGFVEALLAVATTMGQHTLGRTQLRRLCDEVERHTVSGPPAECGISTIARPGAMLAPARFVVWWGFTRDAVRAAPRLRLSEQERHALVALGITPPDAGAQMAGEARRWRRPLTLATEALILVCPNTNQASDAAHPHPLWDELCSAMADSKESTRLHTSTMKLPMVAKRTRVALRALPRPFESVQMAAPILIRETESPSSIEKLLGCSLQWALSYRGQLYSGISEGPKEPSPLLFGTLAHYILAQVFGAGPLTADLAAARAEEVVTTTLADLAENLSLPDHQKERAGVKRAIVETAREVGAILTRTGASIRGVEIELRRAFGSLTIAGRADLVLANPDVVIDYKWGASTNQKRLKAGAAIQLATYAEIGREGDAHPGIAYLILSNQKLLIATGTALTHSTRLGSHEARHMWAATQSALDTRLQDLTAGRLVAPGAVEDPEDSALINGVMSIAPGCDYCSLSTICGRRGGT